MLRKPLDDILGHAGAVARALHEHITRRIEKLVDLVAALICAIARFFVDALLNITQKYRKLQRKAQVGYIAKSESDDALAGVRVARELIGQSARTPLKFSKSMEEETSVEEDGQNNWTFIPG